MIRNWIARLKQLERRYGLERRPLFPVAFVLADYSAFDEWCEDPDRHEKPMPIVEPLRDPEGRYLDAFSELPLSDERMAALRGTIMLHTKAKAQQLIDRMIADGRIEMN